MTYTHKDIQQPFFDDPSKISAPLSRCRVSTEHLAARPGEEGEGRRELVWSLDQKCRGSDRQNTANGQPA